MFENQSYFQCTIDLSVPKHKSNKTDAPTAMMAGFHLQLGDHIYRKNELN